MQLKLISLRKSSWVKTTPSALKTLQQLSIQFNSQLSYISFWDVLCCCWKSYFNPNCLYMCVCPTLLHISTALNTKFTIECSRAYVISWELFQKPVKAFPGQFFPFLCSSLYIWLITLWVKKALCNTFVLNTRLRKNPF